MRRDMIYVFLAVAVALCLPQFGYAQTQPASSYSFSNLSSGVHTVFDTYVEGDFIWSVANVTPASITVRGTLTDSGYQFVHLEGGVVYCGPWNSYDYNDTELGQYGTYAWNVLNHCVLPMTWPFTGSLSVESLGEESFYIGPPTTFSVSGYSTVSACNAHYNAWENGAWNSPWFWDGTAQVLVSPYAAMWHNHGFWDKGWDTNINIYNGGNQSVQYTIHYVSDWNYGDPVMYNPNDCPSSSSLGTTKVVTIGPSGNWSGSLDADIMAPTSGWVVYEDGFIYVTASPVIGGTWPSSYISAHASGATTNCGNCGFVYSCR